MSLAAAPTGWTPATRAGGALLSLLVTERERWALWLPVLVGGGVALYFALPVEPGAGWGAGALAVSCAGAVLLRRWAGPRLLLVMLCALAAGFAAAQLRAALVAAPVISAEPVRGRCAAPVVIDRFDVWRHGAHAVRFTAAGPVVETAQEARGMRPWVDTAGRQRRPAARTITP